MTGKRSRDKGKRYENAIAKWFRELGWRTAKRHLEFQEEEAKHGRDLDDTWPFAVQCKCWKSTPSISSITQVKPDAEYVIPVAIVKRTRVSGRSGIEVAVLRLEDFGYLLMLLKESFSRWPDDFAGEAADDYATHV